MIKKARKSAKLIVHVIKLNSELIHILNCLPFVLKSFFSSLKKTDNVTLNLKITIRTFSKKWAYIYVL